MNHYYLNLLVGIPALSSSENETIPLTECQQTADMLESNLFMFGYPISMESLFIGLLICVLLYLLFEYNIHLHSNEKYKIAMNMLRINRTPLTLLRNKLEDIEADEFPEPVSSQLKEALEYAECVMDCNQNVMTLDKIDEKTKPKTSTVNFELSAYINSLVNHCRPYANLRQVKLEVSECTDCISCKINENIMTAALLQLLHKMIEIAPEGGCVHLDINHSKNSWVMLISTGTPEKTKFSKKLSLIPFMFLLYGYGQLWTVNKVIRLHGGKMTGYGFGKAVTFRIRIPADCQCNNQSCPVIKSYQNKKTDAKEKNIPQVLLVMADRKLSSYLKEALSDYFQTFILENPDEVVDTIIHQKPEIIIIDDNISGVEGDSVCFQVKANQKVGHVPVVLLVRSADHESYLSHIGCGADRLELRTESICKLRANISILIENHLALRERVKTFLSDTNQTTSQEDGTEDSTPSFLEKVDTALETNLSERYTISQLVAEIGMSRSSFYAKIKAITGMSPEDYVNAFKMEKAVKLLATRAYSISEVAVLLGYCDAQYFRKKFKEHYNVTPSEYVKTIIG